MNPPEPIRLPEKTRTLLDDAGRVRGWSPLERERNWKRLVGRTTRPPRRLRRWSLVLAACVVLIVGVRALRTPRVEQPAPPSPPAQTRISVGTGGELTLSSASSSRVLSVSDAELALELQSGNATLEVPASGRAPAVRVRTPSVIVRGFARRFAVSVEGAATRVEVFQGELRVEKGETFLILHAGEAVYSDDPRLTPSAPPSPPPKPVAAKAVNRQAAFDACGEASGRTAYTCFQRLAVGADDLVAGNALFAAAMLARDQLQLPHAALAHLREYQARFGGGPLLPEAMLGIIELLAGSGRPAEAAVEARLFLNRFPNHPAATHVRATAEGMKPNPQTGAGRK